MLYCIYLFIFILNCFLTSELVKLISEKIWFFYLSRLILVERTFCAGVTNLPTNNTLVLRHTDLHINRNMKEHLCSSCFRLTVASVSSYEVSALLNISANKLSSTTLILLLILRGHMVHRHAGQPHRALQTDGERGGESSVMSLLFHFI